MANRKHLARIREGVAAWNAWRRANPTEPIDLIDAKLDHAELDGFDLSGGAVFLNRASLTGASLIQTRLKTAPT